MKRLITTVIYSSSSPVPASCRYKICSRRVESLAAPSPNTGVTGVPPPCIFSAGVTGRGSSLLSLPQIILRFWDSVDSQYV